jgi:site-specific recombinase XerD
LTRRDLAAVLTDATKNARRSANAHRNLVIVRLACCRGLRVSEIAALQFDDVVVDVPRAHLRLRRETTKGKRLRYVTLWWGGGTLADLVAWNPIDSERTLGRVS